VGAYGMRPDKTTNYTNNVIRNRLMGQSRIYESCRAGFRNSGTVPQGQGWLKSYSSEECFKRMRLIIPALSYTATDAPTPVYLPLLDHNAYIT